MGCTSYEYMNYDSDQKVDYLTAPIFESVMARKRAKIQDQYDKELEEAERLEKEYLRQQHLLESLETRGPKSYIDNLIITEIPKMEFGNIASEEEIVKDLNDRDCEVYKEDEKDESEEEKIDIEELKKEEEKNKNEIDELKRQIEEINKKEENNNNKKSKRGRKKGGGAGFFSKKKEDNKDVEENNLEDKKQDGEEEEENEEENERESKKTSKKEKNDEKSNKSSKIEGINEESKKSIKKEGSKEESKKNSKKEDSKEGSKRICKKEISLIDFKKTSKKECSLEGIEEEKKISRLESVDDEERSSEIRNKKNKKDLKGSSNKEIDDYIENKEKNKKSIQKKRKKKEKGERENSQKKKKKKNWARERILQKKKSTNIDKMKELMELKAEIPPYQEQIKRYKYPKKIFPQENKLVFTPSPAELTMCIIGEEKTGKTSFVRKYKLNNFEEDYQKTEKVEESEIDIEVDSKKIKFKIIDTPSLNVRKNVKMIQQDGINKSHIVVYIMDINDEYAEFKVRLMTQSLEFNEKQIIVVIGNKADKVSFFSSRNREAIEDYCSVKRFLFGVISCGNTTQKEIEDFINDKIINAYLSLFKE